MQASYLRTLNILLEDDVTVFSWKVFQATPVLVKIEIRSVAIEQLDAAALRFISTALRNGVLPNLQEIALGGCILGDEDIKDFTEALDVSGCAKQLVVLKLSDCNIKAEGLRALADLISRDGYPALKTLCLEKNSGITDLGVVALAEAILEATQTF